MSEESTNGVTTIRRGAVTIARLARPERSNRLDWSMIVELLRIARSASSDGTRVLVLEGEGRDFCAGDCWPEMGEMPEPYARRLPPGAHGAPPLPLHDLLAELRSLALPVLAVLKGEVCDAGLDLACHCDIRIASQSTVIHDQRVALGRYAATGITYTLPRLIGLSQAFRLLLFGERLGSDDSRRIGLVYATVPDAELPAASQALAQRLSSMATRSFGIVKEQVVEQLDLDYSNALMHSMAVRQTNTFEDRAEGQKAFLEKREPRFTGR